MRKQLLFFSLSLLLISGLFAQRSRDSYQNAVGLRGGFLYGVNFKHFLNEQSAIEAIAGTRWLGGSVTILYEYQQKTNFMEHLDWFVGGGIHGGFYPAVSYPLGQDEVQTYTGVLPAVGFDGIVGLEYKIHVIPLSVGLDFKPFLDLVNGARGFMDMGITIRYLIK